MSEPRLIVDYLGPTTPTVTGKGATGYLTDCKLCDRVIIRGQKTIWLTKPMGLSHQECARTYLSTMELPA